MLDLPFDVQATHSDDWAQRMENVQELIDSADAQAAASQPSVEPFSLTQSQDTTNSSEVDDDNTTTAAAVASDTPNQLVVAAGAGAGIGAGAGAGTTIDSAQATNDSRGRLPAFLQPKAGEQLRVDDMFRGGAASDAASPAAEPVSAPAFLIIAVHGA